MKKMMRTAVSLCLSAAMMVGTPYSSMATQNVSQAGVYEIEIGVNSNHTIDPRYLGLTGCTVSIAAGENGLLVDYSTGFTKNAEEIGIKNLKLQKKSGSAWNTIYSISQKRVYNEASFGGSFTKIANKTGDEYRVSLTYYAVYAGKTYTMSDVTGALTY